MATYSLSGTGTQTLTAGTTQLAVSITAHSSRSTIGRANPTNYFNEGLLRFGNSNGYHPAIPIDAVAMLLDVPSGDTTLGYALLNGCTVSAVEISATAPVVSVAGVTPLAIAPQAVNSIGPQLSAEAVASPTASTPLGSANTAHLIPFWVSQTTSFTIVRIANGTTLNGHFDLGVYDKDLNRLVSTGSTLQAGASTNQTVTVSLTIPAGNYYMAISVDSSSATYFRQTFVGTAIAEHVGILGFSSQFPLPSSLASATRVAVNWIPIMSWANR